MIMEMTYELHTQLKGQTLPAGCGRVCYGCVLRVVCVTGWVDGVNMVSIMNVILNNQRGEMK